MSYSTQLSGRFEFDKTPSQEIIARLSDPAEIRVRYFAGANCWALTRDCKGLTWNGAEDCEDIAKWLQYIIDYILRPAGISLSGKMFYSGESVEDNGFIEVENGKVTSVRNQTHIAELQAFEQFVINSSFGGQLLAEWRKRRAF